MADELLDAIDTVLAARLARAARPVVLGLCGAQGSGKSTLARGLAARLGARGVRCAVLSLDDLYLTRAERQAKAVAVHPLFATRGVPGTHDVGLGLAVFAGLDAGQAVALPRFDKAVDDRATVSGWAPAGVRVVIFEGWCVGARPQGAAALVEAVNGLERERDPDGVWRRAVNGYLAGAYQDLFARIDVLAMLAAPGFEVVTRWRIEQEHGLHGGGMSDAEIEVFVQYYERLTRFMLEEMVERVNVLGHLRSDRRLEKVVLF